MSTRTAEQTANFVQTQRTCLEGWWRAGSLGGSYRFSAGSHDNYLELLTESGKFAISATGSQVQLSDELSLQGFGEGAGLAALELLVNRELQVDPADRLIMLVAKLREQLPSLRLCEDGVDELLETPVLVAQAGPAQPESRAASAQPERYAGTWLDLAATAIAEGRFRSAERLGRQACAAGDVAAAEFLDALSAVRQAAEAVKRHPRSGSAHLGLAYAYFVAESGPAAVQAAERAVALDPTLGDAHALVGFGLLHNDDREGAMTRLTLARSASEVGILTEALAYELAKSHQNADLQTRIVTSESIVQRVHGEAGISDLLLDILARFTRCMSWLNGGRQACSAAFGRCIPQRPLSYRSAQHDSHRD